MGVVAGSESGGGVPSSIGVVGTSVTDVISLAGGIGRDLSPLRSSSQASL